MQLNKFFDLVSAATGLHVCVWSANTDFKKKLLHCLPVRQQRHTSNFCKTVMNNNPSRNCSGHDNIQMINQAAKIEKAFVNVCPAGAAEVIIPIRNVLGSYLAAVFIGQVRLLDAKPKSNSMRFQKTQNRNEYLNCFYALPEMSEEQLLAVGQLIEVSIDNLVKERNLIDFERETTFSRHPAIKQAIKIILSDDGVSISESVIAEKLRLSQSHFSRLFKQEVGYNYSEFVTEIKINKALHFLVTTNLPMSTIAYECGYAKQGYFARIFKKITGSTPTQIRNMNKTGFFVE